MTLAPSSRSLTERKTDAWGLTGSSGDSATLCMIADFPTPAAPNTQRTFFTPLQLAMKCRHRSMMSKRVPVWHRGGGWRADESNSTPGIVFRRRFSMTSRGSNQ